MKITPIEIVHKTFDRKVVGLSPEQVEDFLKMVADELESVIQERNALKEALREKELSIMEYRERDKVLKDTITTAQRMSEKIKEEAEKEAKLILSDAQHKSDVIVREARDSLKRVYREISDLNRTKTNFEVNLKALVGAHLDLLEQQNKFLPQVSEEIL
ncbi:MAG: cell division protein DivIVA [Bdellovibrionales bacterium CG10_big_fil_rev_8_21_14_0_10_45_34]|nr:MAG: cell division protein DivIVA [Bdellovibrionales bacterium CG10_big_fil_rev_8_21_14_0_10_45_34]